MNHTNDNCCKDCVFFIKSYDETICKKKAVLIPCGNTVIYDCTDFELAPPPPKKNNMNTITHNNIDKFRAITDSMVSTFEAKNHDYGNAFEEGCDKFGIVSAVSRIDEKNSRVCTLYENAAISKVNESLEDTLLDMANYCVMLVMYLRDHKA